MLNSSFVADTGAARVIVDASASACSSGSNGSTLATVVGTGTGEAEAPVMTGVLGCALALVLVATLAPALTLMLVGAVVGEVGTPGSTGVSCVGTASGGDVVGFDGSDGSGVDSVHAGTLTDALLAVPSLPSAVIR